MGDFKPGHFVIMQYDREVILSTGGRGQVSWFAPSCKKTLVQLVERYYDQVWWARLPDGSQTTVSEIRLSPVTDYLRPGLEVTLEEDLSKTNWPAAWEEHRPKSQRLKGRITSASADGTIFVAYSTPPAEYPKDQLLKSRVTKVTDELSFVTYSAPTRAKCRRSSPVVNGRFHVRDLREILDITLD